MTDNGKYTCTMMTDNGKWQTIENDKLFAIIHHMVLLQVNDRQWGIPYNGWWQTMDDGRQLMPTDNGKWQTLGILYNGW